MENPTPIRIAISVPNESYVPCEAYDNHMALAMKLGRLEERLKPQYEFYWYSTGRLLTPMAREKLISVAIEKKLDYIMMMDNDMLYPYDFFEAMLKDVEEHPEIDILAPLAFMRNPPHNAVMYTSTEGYDTQRHESYFYNNFVKNYPKDTLIECDAVGFGAVLINMRIFAKMKAPYCFSTTGSGEDIYLCYKAKKEANARIFMDTRIKLGHLGSPIVIDEEYRKQYVKAHGEEIIDAPLKYSYE